jgi:glucose-1-phosphate cytidylyltransferase
LFDGDQVTSFTEKEGVEGGLVNGGYYVMNRKVLDYLSEDASCVLEKKPMVELAAQRQLMAFRHTGYWQCMDTTRDLDSLKDVWDSGKAPWKRWSDGYVD